MLRGIMGKGLSSKLTVIVSMVQPNLASIFSSPKWFHATAPPQDEFGIATGAEREELEWKQHVELFPTYGLKLEGKERFNLTPPRGPIGTKEAPMTIESHYDVRIIGCCGGVGEDEHDISWFHLEKGKIVECSICAQVFKLKVIGVGGQPGHDEHH